MYYKQIILLFNFILFFSCSEKIGCMDDSSCNFNIEATMDDGSCEYAEEYFDCDGACLNDTDEDGICDVLEIEGCMDATACNFNESATNDGECEYAEQNYDCGGVCLNDADGDSICDELEIEGCVDATACNFDEFAIPCADCCFFETDLYNCDGICFNDIDGDGICDEDEVEGCMDVTACNYDEYSTYAGECEYAEENYDCSGACCTSDCDTGTAALFTSICGSSNNCITEGSSLDENGLDCSGECGGSAVEDECGTCDTDTANDCIKDCMDEWGGDAIEDSCGVCSGGNSNHVANSDQDCNDDCFGDALDDCSGECGGSAVEDVCGTCDTDTANDCIKDCMDEWGGDAIEDSCGICSGGNSDHEANSDQDCNGDCFGDANEDCNGNCNGTAIINECGCVEGLTGFDSDYCYTCIDIDGNSYETVLIGDQVWMAENLRVTKYNDGSEINSDDYSSYDEGENNLNFFGYLYSRSPFSNNSSNVCPEGWRTPEKSDVYELKTFLGDDAGSKLAGSVGLWEAGDLRDNAEFGSSGFNALPGGYYNGVQDLYEFLLSTAYFHMVTPSELMWQSQDRFIIKYDNTSVDYGMYQFYESYQLSIRCLR